MEEKIEPKKPKKTRFVLYGKVYASLDKWWEAIEKSKADAKPDVGTNEG